MHNHFWKSPRRVPISIDDFDKFSFMGKQAGVH